MSMISEKWYNFRKQNPGAEVLKLPYDYDSVLHYRRNAFSKDKVTPTILPRYKVYLIAWTDQISEDWIEAVCSMNLQMKFMP